VNQKYYSLITFVTIVIIVYFLLIPDKSHSLNSQKFIKVMSFNVGGSSIVHPPPIKEVVKIIKLENPDIVFIQETKSIKRLKKIAAALDYYFLPNTSNKKYTDASILSRFPITLKEMLTLKGWNKNTHAILGEIKIKDKPILVISVHLKNIILKKDKNRHITTNILKLLEVLLRETFLENYRSIGVEQLVKNISKYNYENIIIGGDFNSVPFSKAIRKMRTYFKDCSWLNKSFFQSSVKAKFLFFPIKVDYIFVSNNLECSGTKILQESPSDHFPIVTNIAF